MSNVVKFYPKDAASDPDAVLEQAIGVYQDVFIIGWDKDNGDLEMRLSNGLKKSKDIIWLLHCVKGALTDMDYL